MRVKYYIPDYNPKLMYFDMIDDSGTRSVRLHCFEEMIELQEDLKDAINTYQEKILKPINTKRGLVMKFLMDSPEALDEERADKWTQKIIEILGIEDADDYLPVKEDKK